MGRADAVPAHGADADGQFVTNTIAVYPQGEPVPHWHLVGYALTAPFEERGYEFTLRVPRGPQEQAPPNWAMGHLENLASYVAKSGNDFKAGHYIEFPDPIDPDRPGAAAVEAGAVHAPQAIADVRPCFPDNPYPYPSPAAYRTARRRIRDHGFLLAGWRPVSGTRKAPASGRAGAFGVDLSGGRGRGSRRA